MSLALVHTRARAGIAAPAVAVEVHLSNGLPALNIVGLPETAVKESKDRVRSALLNAQFEFPRRRITVNLAPADLPKEGGRFDLAIAVGILAASGQLPADALDTHELVGELALSGALRPIEGILPADRRAELEAWVDEKWRAETREYQTSEFSGSSTYEFSATGITCKRIFATQYDGYTRFEVALPHRKPKFDGGYKVRVRRGARYVWAPVKEVGPWNTYDNYWQSARYRTMWEDLPRCKNQSKAAYYNNYNDGEDEFGRKVLNPAGIDLTPAVARKLGLAKYENTWVYVRFPWVRR